MAKVNNFLSNRLKTATDKLSKMSSLAEMSSKGELSSFSGLFGDTELSSREEEAISSIVREYASADSNAEDLTTLLRITTEVKAINNQAVLLHGERIKRVQKLLKGYRDGAFSAWLVAAYGNRQTPYNFLQYFEFRTALSKKLQQILDEMPRQAVYALASREGDQKAKEAIVKNYSGQPKQEVLTLIRESFPLPRSDKRVKDPLRSMIDTLLTLEAQMKHKSFSPTPAQRDIMSKTVASMKSLLK